MKKFFIIFITLIFLSCASTKKDGKVDLPKEDKIEISEVQIEEIIEEEILIEEIEIIEEIAEEQIEDEPEITETDIDEEPEQETIELVEVPQIERQQSEQTPEPELLTPEPQLQTQPQLQQPQQVQPQVALVPEQMQPEVTETPSVIEEPEPEPPQRTQPPETEVSAPFPRETPVTPFQSLLVPTPQEPVFSRIVRATVGQIIEIPFYGTGWVYLGEIASRRGIVYDSRRLDLQGQSFIFRAEAAGTYALKFFKEDFLRDYILNDHVQVIVGEAPVAGAGWFGPPLDRGRVIAEPRWPTASEEAQIQRGGRQENRVTPQVVIPPAQTERTQTDNRQQSAAERTPIIPPDTGLPAVQDPPPLPPLPPPPVSPVAETQDQPPAVVAANDDVDAAVTSALPENLELLTPDELLQKAKETFDAGDAAGAITLLDQYSKFFPSGTDELYWLYGQFYEANTPSRNILLSLEYYRRLIDEYPQSRRFNDARRRIAYLERFYINIQ